MSRLLTAMLVLPGRPVRLRSMAMAVDRHLSFPAKLTVPLLGLAVPMCALTAHEQLRS